MKTKHNHRRYAAREQEDVNPLHAVANLFDVSIVFAVALMVALVSRYKMTEMFSKEDFTVVKNPGKENMEIITRKGNTINKYTPTGKKEAASGNGKKVGTAYELENGEIVYIPDNE
ncbi:MAG: DUF2149 domain-containing protein [Chitinophaga sp.]|uniref:DUF2149 domain-containing protein n=1 Tax=Chitinophaga sp. TaxID=1869181 RepID=UPI0025C4F0D5|nr:DUF2149 domain-containing protein [Chitinophaga sp.]MBV8255996.1 DUF2149 domain-containing protein [Chitinophaga sp.]